MISFCNIGAHHLNGLIERHISKITTRTRAILLHAKRVWPGSIACMLWPFAMAEAINLENALNLDENGRSPLQKLIATDALPTFRDYHAWEYPACTLESKVQTLPKGLLKWEPRAIISMCLGYSPAIHLQDMHLCDSTLSFMMNSLWSRPFEAMLHP